MSRILAAVAVAVPLLAVVATPPASAVDQQSGVTVIGDGTPAGCTSGAVVTAVRSGGVIRFDCGPEPVTIVLYQTAEVVNTSKRVVIDGGGLVTLSGERKRRILRQDTCDEALIFTTDHCDDQATPRLVIKNLTLRDGFARSRDGSGGAVSVRGGRLKILNSTFVDNRCAPTGPDVGGAAVRVLDQYGDRPVVVRDSEFTGGVCSNGGALSSIGVSWDIAGSTFTGNRAIGWGANPAESGTPGGGSGGAIYADGNTFRVRLSDSTITNNRAKEGGGAIFFVSNDRTGTLSVDDSVLRRNPSLGFENYPGIFFLGLGRPELTNSVVR